MNRPYTLNRSGIPVPVNNWETSQRQPVWAIQFFGNRSRFKSASNVTTICWLVNSTFFRKN